MHLKEGELVLTDMRATDKGTLLTVAVGDASVILQLPEHLQKDMVEEFHKRRPGKTHTSTSTEKSNWEMGQIRKRGGVYWVRYSRDGRRFEESAKTDKWEKARDLLRQREGDVAKGVPHDARHSRVRGRPPGQGLRQRHHQSRALGVETDVHAGDSSRKAPAEAAHSDAGRGQRPERFFERAQFEAVRNRLPPMYQANLTTAYHTGWRINSEILKL
jgi:hypothetical protein